MIPLAPIRQKTLGAHGRAVGAVGFGTNGLGGRVERDATDDEAAIRLIRLAVDLGMNFLDTAELYGAGHGEEVLGKAIAPIRDRVIVASKFAVEHSRRDHVLTACENSLRRLGVDSIDLYQMHWPPADVPFEETIEGLAALVKAGKVRGIGFGNVTAGQMARLMRLANGLPVVSVQHEYNIFERFVEAAILPQCRSLGLSLIAYTPLGRGKLDHIDPRRRAVVDDIARRRGLSPTQVILAWVAADPLVIPIPMTSREANLRANAEAARAALDAADMDRLSRAFASAVVDVPVEAITVVASDIGKAFKTLDQARANTLGLSPSPSELAETMRDGDFLKPVKLRKRPDGGYDLFEGQLRFWAWMIAFDGQKPIPAMVIENEP